MSFYQTLLEVIDFRSFSNLWYWLALAVIWSISTHFPLGVSYDMVARARAGLPQAEDDLMDMARIQITRRLEFARASGPVLLGGISFVLSSLAILGWVYWVEFAQALFLIAAPMVVQQHLSFRACAQIEAANPEAPDLIRYLRRHRLHCQGLGVVAIFVSAAWGMYVNLWVPAWH